MNCAGCKQIGDTREAQYTVTLSSAISGKEGEVLEQVHLCGDCILGLSVTQPGRFVEFDY